MVDIWRNTSEESLDNELWRTVKDAPDYEISNLGRVRVMINRLNKNGRHFWVGKIITQNQQSRSEKYLRVNLKVGDKLKSFNVHRLVADAFILGRSEVRNCVNHINAIPTNNFYENLEWVSPQENVDHATSLNLRWFPTGEERKESKIKEVDVIDILKLYWEDFILPDLISDRYGLHPKYAKLICIGKRWKNIYNMYTEDKKDYISKVSEIISRRRGSNIFIINKQLIQQKEMYAKLD